MIISLDTECTGLDIAHGAMPFLVTTCDDEGIIRFWEWDVDPLTRKVLVASDRSIPNSLRNSVVDKGDIGDIQKLIDDADLIYMQNSSFDVRMLATLGISVPWYKIRDTLVMGHLLASNHRHDLTSMCLEYLGEDIDKYEIAVKEVVQSCRAIVKREHPTWRIAKESDPIMPSIDTSSDENEHKPWKADMWLPRALTKVQHKVNPFRLSDNTIANDNWLTACSRYANMDSECTIALGLEMERIIRDRGFWDIYIHRMNLSRLACKMMSYGVTAIGKYTNSTIEEYECYVAEASCELVDIAREYHHDLKLAAGAALNDNMREFFYGSIRQKCPACNYVKVIKHWNDEVALDEKMCPKCSGRKRNPRHYPLTTSRRENLNLYVIESKKSGNATLDKDAMLDYSLTLEEGPALDFIRILTDKRKHDTDLSYMEAYKRFWIPVMGHPDFYRIHPSLNPFGTRHLRWSSKNPNLQNVGTQEEGNRTSPRRCFGPLPDREWWCMDFKNIEKRIPAYESMESALIEIFEKPDDPPYWGSDHLLIASLLFPDEFWPIAEIKDKFKEDYFQKYKKCKNTNFAKQYGAGEKKVESTSGVKGAYQLIDRGLPELAKLQRNTLKQAERTGFVETLPDRTVDPKRGYPILASRTEEGRILSTTPFNYKVSGTACWCKNTAACRCDAQLEKWRKEDGFDGHMILDVHDELVFDFPRGKTPEENLPRAQILRELMEQSGENLIPRIPTPVSISYHPDNWEEGVSF